MLDRLINHEWTTNGKADLLDGKASFRGFYGEYEITVDGKIYTAAFNKNTNTEIAFEV